MAKTDWYRKVSWTPADREDFFAHLGRTRSSYNKAQRLRIQAWHLYADAKPANCQGAMELLDLLLADFPDANEIGAALLQRAKCLEALGRTDDAARDYRRAVKADVNHAGIHTTDAAFHFAMFAARHHRKDLYQDVLDSPPGTEIVALVSQNRYRLCAVMAIIAADQGRKKEARGYAAEALKLFEQIRASASTEDQEILKDLVTNTGG